MEFCQGDLIVCILLQNAHTKRTHHNKSTVTFNLTTPCDVTCNALHKSNFILSFTALGTFIHHSFNLVSRYL